MILNSSCFILCLGCTVKSAARFTTLPQISLALFFLIGPYAIPLAFLKWKAEQQMSPQAVQDMCVVKRIQVSYLTPPLGIYWRMRCGVCIWFFRPEEPGCLCLWLVKMHMVSQARYLWKNSDTSGASQKMLPLCKVVSDTCAELA